MHSTCSVHSGIPYIPRGVLTPSGNDQLHPPSRSRLARALRRVAPGTLFKHL